MGTSPQVAAPMPPDSTRPRRPATRTTAIAPLAHGTISHAPPPTTRSSAGSERATSMTDRGPAHGATSPSCATGSSISCAGPVPRRRRPRRRHARHGRPRGGRPRAVPRGPPHRDRPRRRGARARGGAARAFGGPAHAGPRRVRRVRGGRGLARAADRRRRRCSTSGSARCSSTRRTAASPTASTPRSTCGWTSRVGMTAAEVLNTYAARRADPDPPGLRRGAVRPQIARRWSGTG